MRKTTIFITVQQIEKLAKITTKTGIKFSELVRRAIDNLLEKYYEN